MTKRQSQFRTEQRMARAELRSQIRKLKAQGFSYDEIGAKIMNGSGKPLGRAAAQKIASVREDECPACLRRLERVKI